MQWEGTTHGRACPTQVRWPCWEGPVHGQAPCRIQRDRSNPVTRYPEAHGRGAMLNDSAGLW